MLRGTAPAGQRIEILFTEADRSVEMECLDGEADVGEALVTAIECADVDEAAASLRADLGDRAKVA
jgi:hypothetical protein